jgi:succinyl-CoA synthetase beta subunit
MDLLESEGKAILRQRGIDLPRGFECPNIEQLSECLSHVDFPVMIKAQVLAGGRGKAGGIVKVHDTDSGLIEGQRILGLKINGKPVRSLLVEQVIQAERELYLSLSYDPLSGMPLLLVGSGGGIDVEDAEADSFLSQKVDPCRGLAEDQKEVAIKFLGSKVDSERSNELLGLIWDTFWDLDLELIEINPLMLTPFGELVVADVKMRFNDDSAFRHPDLGLDLDRERSPFERVARRLGLTGVEMNGPVAVLANGAGLSMSVMDSLTEYGLRAGAFLDLSGTDDPSRVAEAVRLLLDHQMLPQIQGLLICVFGGITRCDTVAKGVLMGTSEQPDFPVLVRFRGMMEAEGIDLLRREGMLAWRDIDEACRSLAQRLVGR